MLLKQNLESVYARIKNSAEKSGRKPEDVRLVAVTKLADVSQMINAFELGVRCIGESRMQDSLGKFDVLAKKFPDFANVEKHFIGHLQTNKAKTAVKCFDVIQSVDSLKLANAINKRAFEMEKVMPVFIEVDVCKDETKHGIPVEEAASFYDKLIKLTNIKVTGLMTIPPYVEPEQTRQYFKRMKELYDSLKLKYLSIGMSNDFEIAIEEGSNMVRIGSAIFGEQPSSSP